MSLRRAATPVLLLMVALLLASPARAVEGKAARLNQDGNELYLEGQVEEALNRYAEALALAPDSSPIHYNLGNALYRAGRLEEALDAYAAAVAGAEAASGLGQAARFNEGTASLRAEDYANAVRALREAVVANPDDADARLNLELALARLREEEQKQEQEQDQQEQQEDQEQGDQEQGENESSEEQEGEDRQDEDEAGQRQGEQEEEQDGDTPPRPQGEQQEEAAQEPPAQEPTPGEEEQDLSEEEARRLLAALARDERQELKESLEKPKKKAAEAAVTGRLRHLLRALLIPGLVLAVAPHGYAAVAVRAVVEPETIAADSTVRLRITLDGEEVDRVQPPSLADLRDWSVVNGPSVSSQFRFVNGVSSSRRSFNWVLAPLRQGRLVIPSITLVVGNANFATEPVLVEVTAGGGQRDPGTRGDAGRDGEASADDLFIRAEVEPASPYVGQPVHLRYRLFSRVEVAGVPQLQEVPTYPDFLARELEGPQSIPSQVQEVNGVRYRAYDIRELTLIPTASGRKTIPQVTFSIPLRSQNRRRNSFFFNMSAVEPVYRRTLPLVVEVKPLPLAGRPESFTGAVGEFRMQVVADREGTRTGEAVGLTVDVDGVGNLKSARPPLMAEAVDFTPYEPQEQTLPPTSRDLFASARRWEYILVPHLPGRQLLPGVEFSFFDPEAGRYRTLRSNPLEILVDGQALAEGDPGALPAQQELRRLGSDIAFIKPLPEIPQGAETDIYRSSLFWLLLLAPPIVNLGALGYRWQTRRSQKRLPVARRRRARRVARRRLEKASAVVASDRQQEFYRLVAQALTEFVADKFGVPATGLTYDRIAALLAQRRTPEDTARSFLAVLEECDCARFSPGDSDAAARQALAARAGQALEALGARL